MKSEAALETPTRAQVRQCDPGVLRVPDNRRNRAKNEQSDQHINAGRILNSRRSRGTSANTTKTETISKAFVYLQRKPSPISRPVVGQYHEPWERSTFSKASQNVNIAVTQKKIDSASIVISTAPMLKIGVAFKPITAQRPAVGPDKRRANRTAGDLWPQQAQG